MFPCLFHIYKKNKTGGIITKLIAVGSRFMKDDGVGLVIAKMLQNRFLYSDVEIIYGETDSESCFYTLNPGDFVLILDAMCSDGNPGTIQVFPLKELMEQESGLFMQHDMSFLDLVRIYRLAIEGYLIGIEAAEIVPGIELSLTLQRQLPDICRKVETIIQNILQEETSIQMV
ncbi:hydrogenase maturation protease [Clostridium boliviensis]|uniref:Hydrogenase maturation protease n=1 Tax=Clostridium boliviensis TaxID=318465 RepID=A0ABU4GPF4_9CLOT|nr:hydrogenase maturation protease [Clostridium boliviensis]MDW2798855.1 hydrogenase maturation protease [Clostridium boliviensis]